MNDFPEDLQLLTEDEAAKLLRVKVTTLQNQRWIGKGPRFVRAGKKPLYRLSDLREYLDRSASAPGKPPK